MKAESSPDNDGTGRDRHAWRTLVNTGAPLPGLDEAQAWVQGYRGREWASWRGSLPVAPTAANAASLDGCCNLGVRGVYCGPRVILECSRYAMATLVGSKGQVVIEKAIRDALGVFAGHLAVQQLVGDHVEIRFYPPDHDQSLRGVLEAATEYRVDRDDWGEARDEAWSAAASAATRDAAGDTAPRSVSSGGSRKSKHGNQHGADERRSAGEHRE